MRTLIVRKATWAIAALCLAFVDHGLARASAERPLRPDAVVDLRTDAGATLVQARWRVRDAVVVDVAHRAPGPDGKPSGAPTRTRDLVPRAGAADFDDSSWTAIDAPALEARRAGGKLSFAWFRTTVIIPERVGSFDANGSAVFFEIVVDDYAEVWVDGKLPLVLGQSGGPAIAGFNAPNRVLLGRGVRPGQSFQIAVLGINGPLSDVPGNFVWVRSATLDFYAPERAAVGDRVEATIQRVDPAIDAIVAPEARVEKLARGFDFTEGPVWVPDGQLLFSEPNNNLIYRWDSRDGATSVFRSHSGYTGMDIGEYKQPGSNGLTLDAEGRLTICEHGNRRVTRIEKNGMLTVLADRWEGKRLNSPNDLVYKSDGSLYFTDPPFGLPRVFDDPRKELPFSGVFRLVNGELALLTTDLPGPNGLAFSPDEKYLYVSNWDPAKKVVIRYELGADGNIVAGRVFFDMGGAPGEEALDGLKVDGRGHLFVSGPGGVWVISPEGKHLGTIRPPELPANFAFGDDDARTLYMTARSGLYRIRLEIPGIRPPLAVRPDGP